MITQGSTGAAEESVGKWRYPAALAQLTKVTAFVLLHFFSYFLYRVCAYYFKWKREEKTVHETFEEMVKFMGLTFLYFLASNYNDMLNCSIEHVMIEYVIPFLSSLLISGFLCEASYFRVRLIDIGSWKLNTWIVYFCIVSLFTFLATISFIYCERKDLFFLPVIPVIVYFIAGFIVSKVAKNPHLAFHPRSYQLAFSICLLRKENSFYGRLFAGICTGVFVRCVAANRIESLLDPITNEIEPVEPPHPDVSLEVEPSDSISIPLLEEDALMETVHHDDHEDSAIVDRNHSILETEESGELMQKSRASDVGDWNEQQIQDLLGVHEEM